MEPAKEQADNFLSPRKRGNMFSPVLVCLCVCLADPRDAEAQRMLNIPYRIIIMVIKRFLLFGL